MVAKIEIYTFNIIDKKNDEIKINFDSNTLDELFNYLKINLQNKINQYPPTEKDKKTFNKKRLSIPSINVNLANSEHSSRGKNDIPTMKKLQMDWLNINPDSARRVSNTSSHITACFN